MRPSSPLNVMHAFLLDLVTAFRAAREARRSRRFWQKHRLQIAAAQAAHLACMTEQELRRGAFLCQRELLRRQRFKAHV